MVGIAWHDKRMRKDNNRRNKFVRLRCAGPSAIARRRRRSGGGAGSTARTQTRGRLRRRCGAPLQQGTRACHCRARCRRSTRRNAHADRAPAICVPTQNQHLVQAEIGDFASHSSAALPHDSCAVVSSQISFPDTELHPDADVKDMCRSLGSSWASRSLHWPAKHPHLPSPCCTQVFCAAFQALLYALCYHLEGLLGRVPKAGGDPATGQRHQARLQS